MTKIYVFYVLMYFSVKKKMEKHKKVVIWRVARG